MGAGAVSEEGSSVLHYLAVSQTPEALEVVKLLLENGSDQLDTNAVDWDGYTALMRAASVGDYGIVEYLLTRGADISVKEPNYEKNAEKIAEELAHGKIVDLL